MFGLSLLSLGIGFGAGVVATLLAKPVANVGMAVIAWVKKQFA